MACLVHEHEGKILYFKPTRDFYLTPTFNLPRFLMQLKLFFGVGRAATVHPQLLQPKIQYNSGTKGIHARPQSAPAVGLLV